MFIHVGGAVAVGYFGLAYFTVNNIALDNSEAIFIEYQYYYYDCQHCIIGNLWRR